jgi:ribose 5-phosphate isomerase B
MFNDKEKRVVYLGSDHAGFTLKESVKTYLESKDLDVRDLGCFNEDPCDYPDIAREVGEKIIEHQDAVGIILCGSGLGVTIGANRYQMVRAANCLTSEMAETARRHNDANVLCMGARIIEEGLVNGIVDTFLTTKFETDAERHVRRVDKLKSIG